MDTQTQLHDIIPLTSSTLSLLPQVLPLAWKLDRITDNTFNIAAKRDMQTHQEMWSLCAFILRDGEVRFALSVMTTVMDAYEHGIQPGWTSVITQTASASIQKDELAAVLTDAQAEANMLSLLQGRVAELDARRQALASEVPNA